MVHKYAFSSYCRQCHNQNTILGKGNKVPLQTWLNEQQLNRTESTTVSKQSKNTEWGSEAMKGLPETKTEMKTPDTAFNN